MLEIDVSNIFVSITIPYIMRDLFCGGETGSTDVWDFKILNANDNFAPTGYALAA